MNEQERKAAWLFQSYHPQTLLRWLGVLRYGYLWRASGGHGTDADEPVVALRYQNEQELEEMCRTFGLPHVLKPDEGTLATVGGIPFYCGRYGGELMCFFGVKKWDIDEEEIQRLQMFETFIDDTGWSMRVSQRPAEHPGCITEKRIKELMPFFHETDSAHVH